MRRGRGRRRALLAAGAIARCVDPFAKPTPPETGEARAAIFAALHQNIYRAFDYKTESDVYDTLEQSIGGPLLTEIYLQIQKGLKMQEQGGAIARVREVKIVDGRSSRHVKRPARHWRTADFPYPCRWTVRGTVEHWGHIHTRENEYEAVFTVEPLDSGWKITGLALRNEKRLEVRDRRARRRAVNRGRFQPADGTDETG